MQGISSIGSKRSQVNLQMLDLVRDGRLAICDRRGLECWRIVARCMGGFRWGREVNLTPFETFGHQATTLPPCFFAR
jgi:hypothetical protein